MLKKKAYIFLFILTPILSFCQTSIVRSANASVNVKSLMSLSVTTNGFLDFKFNNNQELSDGIILNNKFNVSITSNSNWILNISTLTSNFQAIGSQASTQMPPDILSIKKTTSTVFVPITQNPNMVALGFKGGGVNSDNDFKMDIKATPGYTFNGGIYVIVLVFNMSPQ